MVRSTCWITGGGEEGDEEDEEDEEQGSETQWKNVFGLQEWLTRAPQGKRPWTEPKARSVVLGDTVWALRVILTPILRAWVETRKGGRVWSTGLERKARRCGVIGPSKTKLRLSSRPAVKQTGCPESEKADESNLTS